MPGNGRAARRGGTPASGVPPVRVLALTVLLAAAAVAGAVAATRLAGPAGGVSWPAVACFFAVLTVVGIINLHFNYGDDVSAIDLSEAVLLPAVLVLPGPVAVALVVAAKAVVEGVLRIHPVKACFNVVAFAAATAASSVAWAALRDGELVSAHNLPALLAALWAFMLVNAASLVIVLALAQRQPPLRVAGALLPMILPGSGMGTVVNFAFGVVFLAVYPSAPLATLLLLVPLGMLHWASRAYAAVRADRARLAGMQRAVSALAVPVDPREAIPRFLEEVRRCFEAESADLVVLGEVPTVHRSRGELTSFSSHVGWLGDESLAAALLRLDRPLRVTVSTADPALLAALVREGWRDCLAVPLHEGGASMGLLCTYNRGGLEGFEEGELAVLEALGGEIAAAMRKGDLLEEVFEQRTKLEEIVTHTSDGIATLDPDGTVRSWNPAFERMTGYSAADVVGGLGLSRLRPRTQEGRQALLERWTDERTVLPGVIEVLTPTGQSCWLECAYSKVPAVGTADGHGYGRLVLTCHDVTKELKLRRAEKALRTSEARFRALVQNSSHMVVVLDAGGGVTYASPAFHRALGYPPDTRTIAHLFDLVHPDDVERVRLRVGEQLADGGAGGPFAFRVLTGSGAWLHLEAIGNNLLGDPSVGGIVLNARDVTERHHAEALLGAQAYVLEGIARAAGDCQLLEVAARLADIAIELSNA